MSALADSGVQIAGMVSKVFEHPFDLGETDFS